MSDIKAATGYSGDGGGIYLGYNFGKFMPGLGNIKATTYLYNQRYSADFNYHGLLSGPVLGFRATNNHFDSRFEWTFRHGKVESSFIDPDTKTDWKLGIKSRYNALLMTMGFFNNGFAFGAGLDIGKFKVFTKRTPLAEYKDTRWNYKKNIYGKKIMLLDNSMYDIMGGWIFFIEYVPEKFGLRFYYSLPMFTDSYASSGKDYEFFPANFGFSLLYFIIKD